MMKKILFSFLGLSMVLSTALVAAPVFAADQVCGMDNVTYNSTEDAETAGVDVSYEFACTTSTSEAGLYEAENDVNFAGMLIEIGSTDLPTTIIVRENGSSDDFTINVTADTLMAQRRDQYTKLSDWIPGDQIRVIGQQNKNTETVDATILVNKSVVVKSHWHANGWIDSIDYDANEITYQWNNENTVFRYNEDTRFVAGLKNPASIEDLKVGDRIRGRLLRRAGETPTATIVVVLRRGDDLFMKIRTFRPNATLVRLDSTIVPTTIQVRIDDTPGLKENDVNNLIGVEGRLVTVNVTEDTVLTRKYFGRTMLSEFTVGDKLRVVGRINDDNTIDAKLIKNNSVWKGHTQGYAAVVTGVDVVNSNLTANYTPIKYLTKKKLKEKLDTAGENVSAQVATDDNMEAIDSSGNVNRSTLRKSLKVRIKTTVNEAIGKFKRKVVYKKVTTNRINHDGVKVKDLVKRLPVQKWRVDINRDTKIIIGTNTNGTISDIKAGDKIRTRGTVHEERVLVADVIVVVNSLPEIEESGDTPIDDINEVVSEIVTDDVDSSLLIDTEESEAEEEIEIDDEDSEDEAEDEEEFEEEEEDENDDDENQDNN